MPGPTANTSTTPSGALPAATLSAAKYLDLDQDLGSNREGKLADLIVQGAYRWKRSDIPGALIGSC